MTVLSLEKLDALEKLAKAALPLCDEAKNRDCGFGGSKEKTFSKFCHALNPQTALELIQTIRTQAAQIERMEAALRAVSESAPEDCPDFELVHKPGSSRHAQT